MSVGFDVVDNKLREADFFLERMTTSGRDTRSWQFFFSAFATAARSVTFVLQSAMADVPGFSAWYAVRRDRLRADPLSRYLTSVRNEVQKRGTNPVCVWQHGSGDDVEAFFLHWYDDPAVQAPGGPVASACEEQVRQLALLVYEAYRDFGPWIDPAVTYTPSGAQRVGLSIDDVEERLLGVRGWTVALPEEKRFRVLRASEPMPDVDDLLVKYLGHDRFGQRIDR